MRSQSWTTKLLAGEKLRDTQRDDASDVADAILSLIWISFSGVLLHACIIDKYENYEHRVLIEQ
jgi:hypothetical protein